MTQPDPTIEDYLEAVNETLRELHSQRDVLRQLMARKPDLVNQLEALNTAIGKALEEEGALSATYEHRLSQLRDAITRDQQV